MPLVKSKSKRAREENIRTEIDAGRPVKQAVAIGYDVQRRAGGGHRTKLEHKKVGAWVKNERKTYT